METIELKDFKGFREPVKFDLERKICWFVERMVLAKLLFLKL